MQQQKLINPRMIYRLFTALFVVAAFFLSANKFTFADILPEIVRINIPIASDNDYRIIHKDKKLDISFTKPITFTQDLSKSIPEILQNQILSDDKKNLSFDIQIPLTISGRRNNNNLLIELIPQQNTKRFLKKTQVKLQITDKENSTIFSFVPDKKILYTINTSPSQTTIYFLTPVTIIPQGQDKYPQFTSIRQSSNAMGGTNYEIPSKLIHAGEKGKTITLEVTTPQTTTASSATDFNNPYQEIASDNGTNIASLSFSWSTPTGAAVFKRGKHLWIAFDHRKKIEINELNKIAQNFVDEIIEVPHTKGTVLRLLPKKDTQSSVRREGLLWIIDLYKGPPPERIKDIALFTQYDAAKNPYFYIPSANSGNILSVVDPEVGDNINIAPLSDLGLGIKDAYDYPDFTFLQSFQGIAIVPKTSNLQMERGNTGIVITAGDKGLHLSPDLESLRRQQSLSHAIAPTEIFDFSLPTSLLEKPFAEAISSLKEDIFSVPVEQQAAAKLNLAKYYIAKGMGVEALAILNELNSIPAYQNTEAMHTLLGVANFLSRRYSTAINHFSSGKLPENDEAIFWRTIASAAINHRPENNAILVSFISLTKEYPQALKNRIASIGAVAALASGDDISAQTFINILQQSKYKDLYSQAEIDYLSAMKRALQGYPRSAIKSLQEIGNYEDLQHSALARYESSTLSNKLGFMSLDKTIDTLERLYYVWSEKQFRLRLLKTLAELYIRNNDYYNAMRKLNQGLPLENENNRENTLKRMVTIFEEIYINNRADNMPILKSLALYQDFEWLAPQSKHYNEIVQKLADRLVSVDLIPRAQQLLTRQLKYGRLNELDRSKTGTRLALINLFEENPAEALNVLNATEYPDIPDSLQLHRKIIRAKTLAELGHIKEAIALLEDDYSKNALLMKSEFYWNNKEWGKAADTIRYLITPPQEGQELTPEQIYYILDWATALNMSGKTTVLLRLRNKFMPYFKNSKHYSTFSILTSNLEHDKIDLKAINQVINDTSAFRNFTRIYNDSLKNNSLSETIK